MSLIHTNFRESSSLTLEFINRRVSGSDESMTFQPNWSPRNSAFPAYAATLFCIYANKSQAVSLFGELKRRNVFRVGAA